MRVVLQTPSAILAFVCSALGGGCRSYGAEGRAPQRPPHPFSDGVDGSSTADMNDNLTTDA